MLRRRLHFKPYGVQLLLHLKPEDHVRRPEACVKMKDALEDDDFVAKMIFSDKAAFHLSGSVNRRNVRFWGTENPRAIVTVERNSPKVNVFSAVSQAKVCGLFFLFRRCMGREDCDDWCKLPGYVAVVVDSSTGC